MSHHHRSLCSLLLTSAVTLAVPAIAADVTPERLANLSRANRTYDGQRFSSLTHITKGNVRRPQARLRGSTWRRRRNGFNEATPLAEDSFLYITHGACSTRSTALGDAGRIVWRMDPKREQQRQNRGAAGGNLVITAANSPGRVLATNKDTGKIVGTTFRNSRRGHHDSAALIKDKIIVGAASSGAGVRDWIAALDAATGKRVWLKYTVPAPGEPGSGPQGRQQMPGRPAAPRSGSPAPMMWRPTRPSGAPATRCRCSNRPTVPATISTPTARSPGIPIRAR